MHHAYLYLLLDPAVVIAAWETRSAALSAGGPSNPEGGHHLTTPCTGCAGTSCIQSDVHIARMPSSIVLVLYSRLQLSWQLFCQRSSFRTIAPALLLVGNVSL